MASTVAQPLEYQFAQIAGVAQMTSVSVLGHDADHHAVRPGPQHRRRRRRRAGGDQRRAAASCRRTCRRRRPIARSIRPTAPIMILAVQSDALPLIEVDDYADNILSQQISQISGVVAGVHRRRAEARGARAGRSRQARRDGPDAGGRARHAGQRHGERARRARSTAPDRSFTDLRQRPAHQGGGVQQRHPGLPQRRAGAGERYRPGDRRAGEPAARRLAERQARHHAGRSSSSPAPTSSRRWSASRRRCRALRGGDPAGDPCQRDHGPHADHPRLGARRAVHADAVDQPGRDGDLPVPAQRLGHDHPQRSPCRWR